MSVLKDAMVFLSVIVLLVTTDCLLLSYDKDSILSSGKTLLDLEKDSLLVIKKSCVVVWEEKEVWIEESNWQLNKLSLIEKVEERGKEEEVTGK